MPSTVSRRKLYVFMVSLKSSLVVSILVNRKITLPVSERASTVLQIWRPGHGSRDGRELASPRKRCKSSLISLNGLTELLRDQLFRKVLVRSTTSRRSAWPPSLGFWLMAWERSSKLWMASIRFHGTRCLCSNITHPFPMMRAVVRLSLPMLIRFMT